MFCFFEGKREKSGASVLGCGAEQLACFNWRLTRQSRESGEWGMGREFGVGAWEAFRIRALGYCLCLPFHACECLIKDFFFFF